MYFSAKNRILFYKKICTWDADFWILRFNELRLGELVLAYSAERTNPIFRKRFKRSAGSDSVVRIANCGIVFVPAYITNVLCHKRMIFRELIF